MTDFERYDQILRLLETERFNGFKAAQIEDIIGIANVQPILNHMEAYGIIGMMPQISGNKHNYIITHLGLAITTMPDGYRDYVEGLIEEEKERKEKEKLELKKLTHEVSISKIQFWLLVIGSVTGFIGFIFSIISFFNFLK